MNEQSDIIIRNLKLRFFDLARKEKIGETPQITREVDHLQEAIRKLQATPVFFTT